VLARVLHVPLILVAITVGSSALAQQPALDPNEQEAQQLFVAGREAMKKGELVVAAEKFQRSLALRPTPGTLVNLASAEEQMGRLVKALEHFEAALKLLPEADERRPVAAEGADRVRPRIPTLRIDRAAGAPADMTIRLDGVPLAASSLGAYQRMDPGTYVVSTSTPGREDRRYEVKLNESNNTTVAVEPGPELAKPQPVPMQPPAGRLTAVQAAGIGALGVGVTGLGVGAVTGVLAIVQKGNAASACPDAAQCNSRTGLDAAASGKALASVSTASFVVGLAGAAAGVALVVAGRDKAAPSAAVAAWALPGGTGLGVRGRF
jgi:tetratricopeptide (TPR) repeat protein